MPLRVLWLRGVGILDCRGFVGLCILLETKSASCASIVFLGWLGGFGLDGLLLSFLFLQFWVVFVLLLFGFGARGGAPFGPGSFLGPKP